jgi:hypothetical protein
MRRRTCLTMGCVPWKSHHLNWNEFSIGLKLKSRAMMIRDNMKLAEKDTNTYIVKWLIAWSGSTAVCNVFQNEVLR